MTVPAPANSPLDPRTVIPVPPREDKEGSTPTDLPPPKETVPVLSDALIRRYGGRLLDPVTAAQPVRRRQLTDGQLESELAYRPTAYVANEILVGLEAARELALDRSLDAQQPSWLAGVSLVQAPDQDGINRPGPESFVRFRIVPTGPQPADAWSVVQAARDEIVGGREDEPADAADRERRVRVAGTVGLNHLMYGAGLSGEGFKKPIGTGGGGAPDDYSTPGWGGRGPVSLNYPPPARDANLGRRPVVAIIDSGVADHEWFDDDSTGAILTRLRVQNGTLVPELGDNGKETDPNRIDPLELDIDPFFGHGTFIAGLVRQHCPDANLISVTIMQPDGIVIESDLLAVLDGVIHRQRGAQATAAKSKDAIDVVSLSMGFYPEDADTPDYGGLLQERLDTLRSLGVTIVAAAGNNSSSVEFLPASLSTWSGGTFVLPPAVSSTVAAASAIRPPAWAPLFSVGGLNPSQSIALFSNGGPWVSCYAPGALLVSTTPIIDAAGQPGRADPIGAAAVAAGWRSSTDPDFFSGWGTWSGTSFAAPILAGELASYFRGAPIADAAPQAMCERALEAARELGFAMPRA